METGGKISQERDKKRATDKRGSDEAKRKIGISYKERKQRNKTLAKQELKIRENKMFRW